MIARQNMLDGIADLERGDWPQALSNFDKAILIRTATPWRESPESAWLLAAAWINRADAFRFLNHPNDAIRDLDQAIDAMQHVPVRENLIYLNRLILAWINRATILGDLARTTEAISDFETAQSLLITPLPPDQFVLAATLHSNRSRLNLDIGLIQEGLKDAQRSVELFNQIQADKSVAEPSLRSRAILCRALALLLDTPKGGKLIEDWIALATDTIEDALSTAKKFSYQGKLLGDLVRYGAKIYATCQPHFLREYLLDCLTLPNILSHDPGLVDDLRREIKLAIENVGRHLRRNYSNPPIVVSAIQTLNDLKLADKGVLQRDLAVKSVSDMIYGIDSSPRDSK